MLRPAYLHREAVVRGFAQAMAQPHAQHYQLSSWSRWECKVYDSDWEEIQRASTCGDRVLGLLAAHVDRDLPGVSEIGALAFLADGRHPSPVFSRDLATFLAELILARGFVRVAWSVTTLNPARLMYDKVVERWGGRLVGESRRSVRRPDGTYCGQRFYEVLPEDVPPRALAEMCCLLRRT